MRIPEAVIAKNAYVCIMHAAALLTLRDLFQQQAVIQRCKLHGLPFRLHWRRISRVARRATGKGRGVRQSHEVFVALEG